MDDQLELEAAVSRAINRVAIVRPTDDVDHLAVDLLDASLGEGGRARDHAIHEALVRFGNRGQDEARHVAIIVGDGSGT